MRTIIITIIIVAVVAVLVLDGLGMYTAHRIAVEVARQAAEQAADVYESTHGSETAAEEIVEDIAREADVEVLAAGFHKASTKWYQVTIKAEPNTYVLGHLPYIRGLLGQESTSVVHF